MVGVASKGGGRINEHFGHAREFHVFEVSSSGVRLIGQRKVPNYCQGGWGNDDSIDAIVDLMRGVTAFCARKLATAQGPRLPKRALRCATRTLRRGSRRG